MENSVDAPNNRKELLEGLHQAVTYIKEQEIEELVHQVVVKVEKLSEEVFSHEEFDLEEK